MALTPWATNMLQWTVNKGIRDREVEAISKIRPQFRSQAATRLREGGIASKRGSAGRAEYVPGPCTHRPSRHLSCLHPKSVAQPQGGSGRRCGEREGRSRNKVAVSEGAAGSPPFSEHPGVLVLTLIGCAVKGSVRRREAASPAQQRRNSEVRPLMTDHRIGPVAQLVRAPS